jgi:hypothetical protein
MIQSIQPTPEHAPVTVTFYSVLFATISSWTTIQKHGTSRSRQETVLSSHNDNENGPVWNQVNRDGRGGGIAWSLGKALATTEHKISTKHDVLREHSLGYHPMSISPYGDGYCPLSVSLPGGGYCLASISLPGDGYCLMSISLPGDGYCLMSISLPSGRYCLMSISLPSGGYRWWILSCVISLPAGRYCFISISTWRWILSVYLILPNKVHHARQETQHRANPPALAIQ